MSRVASKELAFSDGGRPRAQAGARETPAQVAPLPVMSCERCSRVWETVPTQQRSRGERFDSRFQMFTLLSAARG